MKPSNLLNRRESGSAIVGVLVALVFLSIVTAFMLKSVSSQSSASRSYSSQQILHSTTSSGIIATESFFLNKGDDALDILNDAIDAAGANPKPYIFGSGGSGGNSGKIKMADDQYFSSRLINLDKTTLVAQFEVSSGKNSSGRDLKKARAFFKLGNLAINNDDDNNNAFGGSNAIFLGGNLQDGNNGMEIFGDATFEGNVKFQNKAAIFHGTTWINGNVDIPNDKEIRFDDNVYIKGSSEFHFMGNSGSIAPVFMKDVGFGGNINMHGGGLTTRGDVWMNGGSINTMNKNFVSDPYDGEKKSLFTASKISVSGTGSIKDFERPEPKGSPYDIPKELNMRYEDRKEPDLDISKIPSSLIKSANLATAAGGNLSVDRLHKAYDSLATLGELYNDHLVISVTSGTNMNFPSSYSPSEFNRKVIFVLEDWANWNVNGRFYNSSKNASTLIYVKPGASINQFGCNGLFRGLIYVDPANTRQQSFSWGDNSEIDGAALLKGSGSLTWNAAGSSGKPTKITRNNGVLNAFGALVKGSGGVGGGSSGGSGSGKETAAFVDPGDKRIYMQSVGYYFY